ncbi:MAG: hypothetical protein M0Q24_02850 [Sulfurimonas sp.]|uniref:hypothetical protein n=1 Tax=Sulfurimonas sp. TaxID=2022749 RepID=UPI00260155D6|nr:hypothetical protein [Sulfurimonas sp.]MCK9491003.1 hypothetical protein [Sulfurimonas sp.]
MINDSTKDLTPLDMSCMKGISSIQKFLIKQNAKVAPRILSLASEMYSQTTTKSDIFEWIMEL